jgi:DnaK suppressor protein
MQKKELKQLETLLLDRKSILLKEVEERFKKYRDSNNGKLTDIAEIASSFLNGELEMLLTEEDVKELKQIDDALARIRTGHYGTCEQCGRPIKKARLKAIPFTTLCISCKEEEEKEWNERTTQTSYSFEEIIGSPESTEAEDIDKKYLRGKIIELEFDDTKN